VNPTLTWNLASDASQLFSSPFMVNALAAGTIVSVIAGMIGWFMVIRGQSFAGHTLSVMAFPGAAGALLLGLAPAVGYYVACIAAALAISDHHQRDDHGRSGESAAIGTVQATGLALGFLFLSLYHGVLGGLETLLFGTFLGISQQQVITLLIVAIIVVAVLAVAGRPLLFASIDPQGAASQGVPLRLLSTGFLVLLGVAAAATSQITGALLVFALLVTPAATAQTLTSRTTLSLLLTICLALTATWLGLAAAYYEPYPVGFFITTIAFTLYLLAHLTNHLRRRLEHHRAATTLEAAGA
jgi:zinc/manganese transport system permease protein